MAERVLIPGNWIHVSSFQIRGYTLPQKEDIQDRAVERYQTSIPPDMPVLVEVRQSPISHGIISVRSPTNNGSFCITRGRRPSYTSFPRRSHLGRAASAAVVHHTCRNYLRYAFLLCRVTSLASRPESHISIYRVCYHCGRYLNGRLRIWVLRGIAGR